MRIFFHKYKHVHTYTQQIQRSIFSKQSQFVNNVKDLDENLLISCSVVTFGKRTIDLLNQRCTSEKRREGKN